MIITPGEVAYSAWTGNSKLMPFCQMTENCQKRWQDIAGAVLRKFGRRSEKTQNLARRVREMKMLGKSYGEIGKKLHITRQYAQILIRPKGQKATKCERCGSTQRVHLHHSDYRSDKCHHLCIRCHLSGHAKERDRVLSNQLKKEASKGLPLMVNEMSKKLKCHPLRIKKTCIKLGLPIAVKPLKWDHCNWDIPTSILASIWNLTETYTSKVRKKLGRPSSRNQEGWGMQGTPISKDKKRIVKSEAARRRAWMKEIEKFS